MWLRSDGQEMTDEDWEASWIRFIGVFLEGKMPDEVDKKGNLLVDDSLRVLCNSYHDPVQFKIPELKAKWQVELDTTFPDAKSGGKTDGSGQTIEVKGRSIVLLRQLP
jgi:isoamylase